MNALVATSVALALCLLQGSALAQPAFVNTTNVVTYRNFLQIAASCPNVLFARPTTSADVVNAVSSGAFSRVKAVGTGLSYNSWTCPASPKGAKPRLMLDMQGLNNILALDEASSTVLVEAGVRVGDLSRWLYSKGYTLKTFSRQVNVTAGGAACTATHGSSVLHGTFSSSIVAVEVVLANGTVVMINAASKSPKTKKAYLPAFRASLGRLGVITKLNISVEPDYPVTRTQERISVSTFISRYLNKRLKGSDLAKLEGDNFFYQPTYDPEMPILRVHPVKMDNAEGRAKAQSYQAFYNATRATSLPSFIPADVQAIMLNATAMQEIRANHAPICQTIFNYFVREALEDPPVTWKSIGEVAYYQATLATRAVLPLRPGLGGWKLDIYEVAVQMKYAKRCLTAIDKLITSDQAFKDSIYAFLHFRFVKESQPVLLSPTLGNLALYFDLDAYSYDNQGRQFHLEWNRIIDTMTGPDCRGVLHWGLNGPWRQYSTTPTVTSTLRPALKSFKAVADEVDPQGLFATELDGLFF